jgi:hypothetical protein
MLPACLALFLASVAWTAAAQTPGAGTASCGAPSLADKVELNQVAGSKLMTVPVAIEGKPKQFLLAVGANPDEISQAAVTELHLAEPEQRTAYNSLAELNATLQYRAPVIDVRSAGAAAAKAYQPRVRATAFTIGTATLPGLQFLVSNDRDLGGSKPYDGLLTAAGFRQYDMDIDFGGKQLTFLAARTGCADPGQIVRWPHTAVAIIAMGMNGGKMSIPVTVMGHEIEAVIDTGSERTVMRRAIAERVLGLKTDTDMTEAGDLRDGTGRRVYQHIFPDIRFEGVVASNVPALIQEYSLVRPARRAVVTGSRLQAADTPGEVIPDLTLGMDVLSQLHIFAAFQDNKLYITPAA